eukprot:scaffold2277_cov256-Pinguiococcus_pyrenoidosus.AAC.28
MAARFIFFYVLDSQSALKDTGSSNKGVKRPTSRRETVSPDRRSDAQGSQSLQKAEVGSLRRLTLETEAVWPLHGIEIWCRPPRRVSTRARERGGTASISISVLVAACASSWMSR